MTDTNQKEWLTITEAAKYLGVSYGRLTTKVKQGVFPASLVPGFGDTKRISRTKLDQMMHENEIVVRNGDVHRAD